MRGRLAVLPRAESVALKSSERLARGCLGAGEAGDGASSEMGLGLECCRLAASGAWCLSAGAGGGGGGGVTAVVRAFPGLATLPELPLLLNEKYDATRCSSGLLGLAAPDDTDPERGVLGVMRPGEPILEMWSPISRRRAFHPGVADSLGPGGLTTWVSDGDDAADSDAGTDGTDDGTDGGGPGNGSSRDEPMEAWRFPPDREDSREVSCGRDCRGLVLVLDVVDVLSGGVGAGGVGGITFDEKWDAGLGNLIEDVLVEADCAPDGGEVEVEGVLPKIELCRDVPGEGRPDDVFMAVSLSSRCSPSPPGVISIGERFVGGDSGVEKFIFFMSIAPLIPAAARIDEDSPATEPSNEVVLFIQGKSSLEGIFVCRVRGDGGIF